MIRRLSRAGLRLAAVLVTVGIGIAPVSANPEARIVSTSVVDRHATINLSVVGVPNGTDGTAISSKVRIAGADVTAQTQLTLRDSAAPISDSTLVLALDSSGSMAGGGMYAAKLAARAFVEQLRPDIRIGLVTFGSRSNILLDPTTDRRALYRAIGAIRPRGSTALYDAVADAISIAGVDGERRLLVLTDGDDSSSRRSLASTLDLIAKSDVRVDAVKLVEIPAVEALLQQLAAAGNGQVFTGTDATGLLAAFEQSLATTDAELGLQFDLPADIAAGTTSFTVTLGVGGESTVVVGSLDIPAVQPEQQAGGPGRVSAPTAILTTLAVVFGVSLLLFLLLITAGSDRAKRRRIEQVLAIRDEIRGLESAKQDDGGTALEALEDLVRPLLKIRKSEERLTLALDGAGMSFSPEQWLLIRIAMVVLPLGVLSAIGMAPIGVLVGALGAIAPAAFLSRRRRQRSAEFEAGLPDVLLLMASTLRSGFSLEQAIITSAEQSDGPVAAQLRRSVQELRLGLPLETALSRVAERMASNDFAWVVAALQIQRKSGGNLSELLSTAAGTVRERSEIRREVLALTAEGRMSSNVLISMPFGIFAYMLVVQPNYIAPLWTTGLGRMISFVGLVMLLIGWLLMKKIVKVEV